MPVTITIGNAEARRMVGLLRETTDHDFLDTADFLERELARRKPKAPWRKVVRRCSMGSGDFEKLECGHRRRIRTGNRYSEGPAQRRRCKECQEQ